MEPTQAHVQFVQPCKCTLHMLLETTFTFHLHQGPLPSAPDFPVLLRSAFLLQSSVWFRELVMRKAEPRLFAVPINRYLRTNLTVCIYTAQRLCTQVQRCPRDHVTVIVLFINS